MTRFGGLWLASLEGVNADFHGDASNKKVRQNAPMFSVVRKAYVAHLLRLAPLLLLSGCALFEANPSARPRPSTHPVLPYVRAHIERDPLGEIRNGAATLNSTLEVVPVESPSVALLLARARQAESELRFPEAQSLLSEALKEEPDNPRVYQSQAELALKQRRFDLAERLAMGAFERSAQVGELCARSWLTVAEARLGRSDVDATAQARRRALACAEHGIIRY